jgi:phosphoglycerate kinase
MKTLNDIEHLKGVKVLVRVDWNVPIKNGAVADDMRIKAAMPTIDFLRAKGAKIIFISHLESNDGSIPSLQPVADYLKTKLGLPVMFVKNIRAANDLIENELPDSGCMMLENLRSFDGEKSDDQKFARELASLADIFVNEAFSVCHREHASIVSLPKFLPSYAGLELEKEIANLSKAFNPAHPFLFILGGAKFETKLPLLSKFMDIADTVFVGGALASDFFKAKGYEVGKSLVSDLGDSSGHPSAGGAEMANDLKKYADNPKLLLPIDVTLKDKTVKSPDSLDPADAIADSGPKTVAMLQEKVNREKFILWNGPLGMYEDGYRQPTLDLARMIGEASAHGAETIVGGGDTLAAIASLGISDKFSFVSTAGGAMLDFLAKGTLPGIEALNDSQE